MLSLRDWPCDIRANLPLPGLARWDPRLGVCRHLKSVKLLGLNFVAVSSNPVKDFWKRRWHSLHCFCLAVMLSPKKSQILWKQIPLYPKSLGHEIFKLQSVCQWFQVARRLIEFPHTHAHSRFLGVGCDRLWSVLCCVCVPGPSVPEPPDSQLQVLCDILGPQDQVFWWYTGAVCLERGLGEKSWTEEERCLLLSSAARFTLEAPCGTSSFPQSQRLDHSGPQLNTPNWLL